MAGRPRGPCLVFATARVECVGASLATSRDRPLLLRASCAGGSRPPPGPAVAALWRVAHVDRVAGRGAPPSGGAAYCASLGWSFRWLSRALTGAWGLDRGVPGLDLRVASRLARCSAFLPPRGRVCGWFPPIHTAVPVIDRLWPPGHSSLGRALPPVRLPGGGAAGSVTARSVTRRARSARCYRPFADRLCRRPSDCTTQARSPRSDHGVPIHRPPFGVSHHPFTDGRGPAGPGSRKCH